MRKLILAFSIALTLILSALPQSSLLLVHAATSRQDGDPNVRVWVNTSSDIYWCPGSQWYGKTKRGFYTTQREAQQAGYRPAYYRVCRGTSQARTPQDERIRGNRRSMIYHWPGCPNYDDIAPHNRVHFRTRAEAEAAGYRAARNCY